MLFIIISFYKSKKLKSKHCMLNDKKVLKKIGLRTWCTKKPFGYRVVHHKQFTMLIYLDVHNKLLLF